MLLIRKLEEALRRVHYSSFWRTAHKRYAVVKGKPIIEVVFVLHELASWKTEMLYLAMREHPRFKPMLVLTLPLDGSPDDCIRRYYELRAYVVKKKYEYIQSEDAYFTKYGLSPDIIFYQKPYEGILSDGIFLRNKYEFLFMSIPYGFYTIHEEWCFYSTVYAHSLYSFVENESVKKCAESLSRKYKHNFVVTGLPFTDELMLPKERYENPWKPQTVRKKRIIWAPHHSFPTTGQVRSDLWINYSTFLEVADIMLDLAQKYSEKVQFAFKPHPLLRNKAEIVWGKERTDNYFKQWAEMENTQLEEGEYMGLFKYSDAMIHDCGSFTVEYLYTGNPVMYLVNGQPHVENLTEFGRGAYAQHYMGHTKAEIEQFMENVINGIDPMKEGRQKFYEDCLLPPHGKSACENILNAILGEAEYKGLKR